MRHGSGSSAHWRKSPCRTYTRYPRVWEAGSLAFAKLCMVLMAGQPATAEQAYAVMPNLAPAGLPSSEVPGTGNASDAKISSIGLAPARYRLVWSDEFDVLNLSDTPTVPARWLAHFGKWNVRYLGANGDEGVKVSGSTLLPSGRTVFDALSSTSAKPGAALHEIADGRLKLRAYPVSDALRPEFWGFPYAASMISGERSFAQRYGYWEIRLRINKIGKGQHFSLWLLPKDGTWPPEIDLLEVVGTKPHEYSANTHLARGVAPPPMTFYQEPAAADGFHVFGFLRTAEFMRWTTDGKTVRHTPDLVGDTELYLIASWEIGGHWAGKPDASTPWPAEVEIDYVRIYAPP